MSTLITQANESFGNRGERVLAFARLELDSKTFTSDPPYQFDFKHWKEWQDGQKQAMMENFQN